MDRRRAASRHIDIAITALLIAATAARSAEPPAAHRRTALPADASKIPRVLSDTALVDVVDRVAPSIVAVQVTRRTASEIRSPDADHSLAPAPAAEDLHGAGVILDSAGLVATAAHVVRGADVIHVVTSDGQRCRAATVGADPYSDLAVVRISAGRLTSATLGDAGNLRRGQAVVAFGNPWGIASDGQASVALGIVSGLDRAAPMSDAGLDAAIGGLIQTSAAINPGDSGGALVDLRGRIVGLITRIQTTSGAGQGVGFAIPINPRTREILAALSRGELVAYADLGAGFNGRGPLASLDAPAAGACITEVAPQGPAASAGLQAGDCIERINGRPVNGPAHLFRLIGACSPGTAVQIAFRRGDEVREATAVLARADRPSASRVQESSERREWRGATMIAAASARHPNGTRSLAFPPGTQLVVAVEHESPAERAGLEPGDLIVRISGSPLTSIETTERLLATASGEVLLGLQNGSAILVAAP